MGLIYCETYSVQVSCDHSFLQNLRNEVADIRVKSVFLIHNEQKLLRMKKHTILK